MDVFIFFQSVPIRHIHANPCSIQKNHGLPRLIAVLTKVERVTRLNAPGDGAPHVMTEINFGLHSSRDTAGLDRGQRI